MIKIQIRDIVALKSEYLLLLQPLVVNELKRLKLSLEHLQDYKKIKIDDIVSVKTITKEIVNIIRTPSLPSNAFNKAVYVTGVANYPVGAKTVYPTNFLGLSKLLDLLLDLPNKKLESLLTCEPEKLKETNDNFLRDCNIGNSQELDIIRLAFFYQGYIAQYDLSNK